jgi:hypothetical protein
MLEIVFDILEGNPISFTKSSADTSAVLRYLRSNRSVLLKGSAALLHQVSPQREVHIYRLGLG